MKPGTPSYRPRANPSPCPVSLHRSYMLRVPEGKRWKDIKVEVKWISEPVGTMAVVEDAEGKTYRVKTKMLWTRHDYTDTSPRYLMHNELFGTGDYPNTRIW